MRSLAVSLSLLSLAGCLSASAKEASIKKATERAFAAAVAVGEDEAPCRETIGKEPALTLVRYCRWNSSATRPPCNTANHCALIVEHIRGMCRSMPDGPNRPLPCAEGMPEPYWESIRRMPAL